MRTVRGRVYKAVVVHAAYPGVIEDARAAPQTCLAIAEDVPGKAQPGSEVIHAVPKAIVREAIVSRKEESRRRVGKYC